MTKPSSNFDMDLKSYIKVYENALSEDVCKKSIDELEKSKWHKNSFYRSSDKTKTSISGDKEPDVFNQIINTRPDIMQAIYFSISRYVNELNFSWYTSWNGFTGVDFHRYQDSQLMALHCDHIHSIFPGDPQGVPILSVIGGLNDEYDGGELVMFKDFHVKLPKAAIMVFPSNFLYPHTIKPVTKGVRYSFVSWCY